MSERLGSGQGGEREATGGKALDAHGESIVAALDWALNTQAFHHHLYGKYEATPPRRADVIDEIAYVKTLEVDEPSLGAITRTLVDMQVSKEKE